MKTLSYSLLPLTFLLGCPVDPPSTDPDMIVNPDADMPPDMSCTGTGCVGPECTTPADCTKDPMTMTPKCDTGMGKCVSCTQDADCGTGGFCFKIGDCSTVSIPNLKNGQCIFSNQFTNVNNASGCAVTGPTYCNVAQATDAGKNFLKVEASGTAYPAFNIASGNYVIVGAGTGTRFNEVTVTGGSVVFSNVNLAPTGLGNSLTCNNVNAKVCLLESVVNAMGTGINAQMCGQIEVARTRVTSTNRGIWVTGSGATGSGGFRILNTAIASASYGGSSGQDEAVVLGSNANGYFGFNTITRYLKGINCIAFQPIEDSIVTGNMAPTQVSGCMTTRVATMNVDLAGGLEPKLTGRTANNTACCIDKGMPSTNVPTDFYGTVRPQGAVDIGYHEQTP